MKFTSQTTLSEAFTDAISASPLRLEPPARHEGLLFRMGALATLEILAKATGDEERIAVVERLAREITRYVLQGAPS